MVRSSSTLSEVWVRRPGLRLTLLALTVALICPSCAFLKYPRDGVYLLPKGFVGDVIIMYGVPDGVELQTERGLYVYNIPADGMLLVKDKASPGIVNTEYYYVDEGGNRQAIPTLRITGDRSINGQPQNKFGDISIDQYENTIYVTGQSGFGSMTYRGLGVQYTTFVVSTPRGSDDAYNRKEKRMSEIMREEMRLMQKH